MATIDDIAKLAGVSHGTVSNVLNKTGKVSLEKVKLVEDAIAQLGYTYNVHARYLRQGDRKLVAAVIPSLQITGYRTLVEVFKKVLLENQYEMQIYETDDLAGCEEQILNQLAMIDPSAVVAVTCLDNAAVHYRTLSCPKIFINRSPGPIVNETRCCFATFDYLRAGQETAKYIHSRNYKNIALISIPASVSDEYEFYTSIKAELINACNISNFVLTVRLAQNQAMTFLQEHPYVDCIVVFDDSQAAIFHTAINMLGITKAPDIICVSDYSIFPDDRYVTYQMNYFQMGKQLAQQLLECLQKGTDIPSVNTFHCQGLRHISHSVSVTEKKVLSMLNLQSPTSEALKMLAPQFERETGIRLNITALPHDSLLNQIEMISSNSYFDLIRMDITWFSEFAQKLYIPLDSLLTELNDVPVKRFSEQFLNYMQLDGKLYCLPFDPSILILLYRQDLFTDAVIRRSYYEKNGHPLKLPTDFEEYNRIAEFFTRACNPDSPVLYGTALAYGTGPLAVCDFLVRLLASGDTVLHNGRITLDTDYARKALNNYKEAAKYAPPYEIAWWPQVVKELAEGRCAMVTTFSNHASYMQDQNLVKMAGKIGCAEIPGRKSLLGGGPIGISRHSQMVKECLTFFKWYYSEETSSAIVSLGGISPRAEVLDNYDYSLYPWLSTSSESFHNGIRGLTNKPIPGFPLRRFEYLLGSVVRDCVKGIINTDVALHNVQSAMDRLFPDKISDRIRYS